MAGGVPAEVEALGVGEAGRVPVGRGQDSRTVSPAGTVTAPIVTSSTGKRRMASSAGPSWRANSSTAFGNRSGFARRAASWSGWLSSPRMALPMSCTVFS